MKNSFAPILLALALIGGAAFAPSSAHAQTRTVTTYMGAYSSGTTYHVNDMVASGGVTYISLIAVNLNHTPASSPTQWSVIGGLPGVTSDGANGMAVAGKLAAGTTTPTTMGNSGVTFPDGSVQSTRSLGASDATVVVAASNSPNRAQALVQCTGTNDQTCINNALANYCPKSATAPSSGCNIILMNGLYNLSGPVVISDGGITLGGQNKVMWGGYIHPAPCSVGNPCGNIGTAGARLQATASGFNPIEIIPSVPCGNTPGDSTRCRGIAVHDLYVVCYQYNDTGINEMAADDDNIQIYANNIQRCNQGIASNGDTPDIWGNSIQDDGGDAITAYSSNHCCPN